MTWQPSSGSGLPRSDYPVAEAALRRLPSDEAAGHIRSRDTMMPGRAKHSGWLPTPEMPPATTVPGRGPYTLRWNVRSVSLPTSNRPPVFCAVPSWPSGKAWLSVRRRPGVIKALKGQPLQRRVEKPLKGAYLISIVTGDKCNRISILLDPSGATDAMDIIVRACRHIIVDDV